ncbi:MAG: alpha-galactosidase [Rhodoglobus sp.]|nr:alpha-galactosidase [Rhodoglobus sp.]
MTYPDGAVIALRAAGVSFVVDPCRPVPRVLHWGKDLGELGDDELEALRLTSIPAILNNSPDVPRTFSAWPTESEGWSGTPAQTGHAGGVATTPRPVLESVEVDIPANGVGGSVTFTLVDETSTTRPTLRYSLSEDGIVAVDMSLERHAPAPSLLAKVPYELVTLTAMLPLPERASEIVDFSGKWCRERSIQRTPVRFGTHRRDARRGKPGHDSPFMTLVGTPGFSFGRGEVWGMHVAWSGNQHTLVERLPEGAGALSTIIGGGGSVVPGEILLADGDLFAAPTVYFTWSDTGMDGISDRFHRTLRRRPSHPAQPRPLVLNTWEAVYFDHDLGRLESLVDTAARVGVERVVLDDGWFSGRRDAGAGLGDWFVDATVWPAGLSPIVERIRSHSMQFGLWFEPEMINLDSELARRHPDWILGPSVGLGATSRNQYVLNIANPEAYDYLLERIGALVNENSIDYIKWDHNRDLHEAVARTPLGDRPSVRAQTLALYSLIDDLRARHPGLEIETCAGGGGRIDLGILERTDRVWASDCNDPVERAEIDRWTAMLLPPELIGTHVGAARSHTTGRVTDASFRLAVALFAHSGIERDLTLCDEQELEQLTAWAGMYREFRPLLHTGRVVNADLDDVQCSLRGVVAHDGSHALFAWIRLATSPLGQTGRVAFPGLDATARYEVRVRNELGAAARHEGADPAWVSAAVNDWTAIPGSVIAIAGLPLPTLNPEQAMLIEFRKA